MSKKIIAALLCFIMIFSVSQSSAFTVSAETVTTDALLALFDKFPHRAYWNHVGSKKNSPDSVTNMPCPDHKGCSWVAGECSCNSFFNAIQCMGYAYKTAYEIVGTDPRNWEVSYTLDASKLRVGDVIRYRWNGHSLTVTGIKGNVISFTDANWYPMCQIRWSQMDLDDMPGFSYVMHDPKNKLKNKNINFHVDRVEKIESNLGNIDLKSETWVTSDAVNLRKKASASSNVICTVSNGTKIIPTQKKISGGYLWGKVKYGMSEGWIALDNCKYVSGRVYAPELVSFSEIQPLDKSFKLTWSKVEGANKYKVEVFDLYGNCVKSSSVKSNSISLKLSETGKYLVNVTSVSDHASSWTLKTEDKYITVLDQKDILISAIILGNDKLRLELGEEADITYNFDPYCASDEAIFWYSDNGEVADVDEKGSVIGKKYGQANIVCESNDENGASASCEVTVCPIAPVVFRQDTSKICTDKVTLKWTKVPNVDGYDIYRKKSNGNFKLVGTTDKTSFTDINLYSSREYVYKICAYIYIGENKIEGFDSEVLSTVTRPEKVTDVTAKTSKDKVTLKWQKNKYASGYVIYQYSKKNDKYTRIGMTEKSSFSLKAKSGEKAYFKIRAIKTLGDKNYLSDYSSKISVKIP